MIHYTTIEQAEHLIELGLDLETADMYYFLDPTPAGNIYHLAMQGIDIGVRNLPKYNDGDLPCWSLGALSNVIYKFVIRKYGLKGWVGMYVCSISEFTTYYANDADVVHEEKGETLLEAIYNMVCYLLKRGYIKKHKL